MAIFYIMLFDPMGMTLPDSRNKIIIYKEI